MKPNLPYHFALLEGKIVRNLYRSALPLIVRRPLKVTREIPLGVFAYSGENSLPEQVASIRSFLKYAGRPRQFTVVSDGSYTARSAGLLEKIDNCVRVEQAPPAFPSDLPENVQSFFRTHFTGRQLALIMSLPTNDGPALYTDSDVLFFPGATCLDDLSRISSVSALYLADYQLSVDQRLIQNAAEKQDPVNMGFLLLYQRLDWSPGVQRLQILNAVPNFFTTQTVVHLCVHANHAQRFDPNKFILRADDQTIYRDKFASSTTIAVRHYVNPVRHKFWTTLAHRGFA